MISFRGRLLLRSQAIPYSFHFSTSTSRPNTPLSSSKLASNSTSTSNSTAQTESNSSNLNSESKISSNPTQTVATSKAQSLLDK